MSADEDTELRDLVAQTLEANGTLGKLRAQLRASVFLALEDQENGQSKTPFLNKEFKSFLSTKEGKLTACLVQEFLEYFNLEFTLAVFKPETGLNESLKRSELVKSLGIESSQTSSSAPVLTSLLSILNKQSISNSESGDAVQVAKNLTEKQIEEARKKFDFYDKDGSGAIEKDELRDLFMDMFPSFHRNMLERYVNDEFAAADRDFNSSIDFDEFLGMYKRLFLLCRTVVSHDVADIISPKHKLTSKTSSQTHVSQAKQPASKSVSPPSSKSEQVNGLSKRSDGLPAVAPGGYGSDIEEDPFFDDQPVGAMNYNTLSSELEKNRGVVPQESKVNEEDKGSNKVSSKGMTSLADLPSLTSGRGGVIKSPDNDSPRNDSDMDQNLREVDKRIEELGIDSPDDDYEDDFSDLSQKSPRKGDSKPEHSVAEEIYDEEIVEDISVVDDLLRSEKSGYDDLTTDRSISQIDGGFDYMEDPVLP